MLSRTSKGAQSAQRALARFVPHMLSRSGTTSLARSALSSSSAAFSLSAKPLVSLAPAVAPHACVTIPFRTAKIATPELAKHASAAMARERIIKAIGERDVEALRAALAIKGGPGAKGALDNKGATALHYVASVRAPELIPVLLAAGADLHAFNSSGATPLGAALVNRNEPIATALLDAGSRTDAGVWPASLPSALTLAVAAGLVRLAERLLADGAPADGSVPASPPGAPGPAVPARSPHGAPLAPPLPIAVMESSAPLVSLLLRHGADPSVAPRAGSTGAPHSAPLLTAVVHGTPEIVSLLLAAKADVSTTGSIAGGTHSPLALACYSTAPTETIAALLAAGADPNAPPRDAPFPLSAAVGGNRLDVVELLLARGADPNQARSSNGGSLTPLFDALEARYDAVALALLRAGADPNAAITYDDNGNQCSPLMYVSYFGSLPLVEALLAAGANPNFSASPHLPLTALHIATTNGYAPVVSALLASGADPNAAVDGVRPLQLALALGFPSIARALVAAGADVSPAATVDNDTLLSALSRFFFTLEDVCPDLTNTLKYYARRRGSVAVLGDLPMAFQEWAGPVVDGTDAVAGPAAGMMGGPTVFSIATVPTTTDIIAARRAAALAAAAAAATPSSPAAGAAAGAAAGETGEAEDDDDEDVEVAVTPAAAAPASEAAESSEASNGTTAAAADAAAAAAAAAAEADVPTPSTAGAMSLPLRQKAITELFKFNSPEDNLVLLPSTNGVAGTHPLVHAAWLGDAELVSALLARYRAAAAAPGSAGVPQAALNVALAWAATQGNAAAARVLLDAGAHPRAPLDTASANATAKTGKATSTILSWTASYERAEADRWRLAAADAAAKDRTRERDIHVRRAVMADLAASEAEAATAAASGRTVKPKMRSLDEILATVSIPAATEARIAAREEAAGDAITAASSKMWVAKAVESKFNIGDDSTLLTPLELAKARLHSDVVELLTSHKGPNT